MSTMENTMMEQEDSRHPQEEEYYDEADENEESRDDVESNGGHGPRASLPSYAELMDSMKDMSSTIETMQDQVFKLELEMADVTMQMAYVFDPNVVEFAMKAKELEEKKKAKGMKVDSQVDEDKLLKILPRYSAKENDEK